MFSTEKMLRENAAYVSNKFPRIDEYKIELTPNSLSKIYVNDQKLDLISTENITDNMDAKIVFSNKIYLRSTVLTSMDECEYRFLIAQCLSALFTVEMDVMYLSNYSINKKSTFGRRIYTYASELLMPRHILADYLYNNEYIFNAIKSDLGFIGKIRRTIINITAMEFGIPIMVAKDQLYYFIFN